MPAAARPPAAAHQFYQVLGALSLRATGTLEKPQPYCEVEQVAVVLVDTATGDCVDEIVVDVVPDYRDLPTLGWDDEAADATRPDIARVDSADQVPTASSPIAPNGSGVPLSDAIATVDKFLADLQLELGPFIFVTDCRWPLNSCLKVEAACKRLALRQHWAYYLDMRIEALKCGLTAASGEPATAFPDVLTALGLKAEPVQPGLEAARALAGAACEMLRRSHLFMSPQVVGELTVSQMEQQWKTMTGCESDDPVVAAVREKQVVCIKGAQNGVSVGHIQAFFAPLEVAADNVCVVPADGDDLHVYVRFRSPEDWLSALKRYSRVLGGHLIDVLPTTAAEMEAGWAVGRPVTWDSSLFVHCSELPLDADFTDVEQLLAPHRFNTAAVFFVRARPGDAARSAYVQMLDATAARRVAQSSPTGRVQLCGPEELQRVCVSGCLQQVGVEDPADVMPEAGHEAQLLPSAPVASRPLSGIVVRLRGLPYSVTEMDVAQFFDGVNIAPRGIHLMFTADERPLGDAFVELVSEADLGLALARHRQSIGHRYVEVFKCNPNDLHWVMESAVKLTPPLVDSPELSQHLPALFPLPIDYPHRHKFHWALAQQVAPM